MQKTNGCQVTTSDISSRHQKPQHFQAKNNRSQLTTNKTYLKQIVVTLKLNTVKAA